MPDPSSTFPVLTVNRLALALGMLATLAVGLTLGDPGITTDEPLDVRPGRTYVATLRARGWHFFDRGVVETVFRDNAEHPPLGRWLLGLASTLGEPFETALMGTDPTGLYLHSGRLAPAAAFGVLVGIVALAAGHRYGRAAGVSAGFALGVMPRIFAHAHFGALDTFISLFWTLALLDADRALRRPRPALAMAAAGSTWALALLTKIHAWFLAPVVLAWAIVRLGWSRALAAVSAWFLTGFAFFVMGWPWLWYHFATRLRGYLSTGVHRASIRVLYFGQVYADRDVPWHYPWFYFAATVPVGLLAFGLVGLVRGWRDRRADPFPILVVAPIAMFLVVFSTRVPVYDGERLFLMVFPLWAILVGRGFAAAWSWSIGRRWLRAALVAALLAQGYGVVAIHPFGLSYYNALVGGLLGAERLGLELTYWGDAVDRVLLDRLAREARPDDPAALAPTLYPGQGLASTTRGMARRPVVLQDEDAVPSARWVVVSRRTAYWRPGLRARLDRGRALFIRSRQGVWLSGIWE